MWLLHQLSWNLKWAFLTPVVHLSVLFTIKPFTKFIQIYHEEFVYLFCLGFVVLFCFVLFCFVFCFVCFVLFCLSVCLSLPVPLETIHSYGDVTTTGWGVQSLTYSWHSWPLSTEGSLACHTYWDTGHPIIYNGHLRGPVKLSPIAERLAVELSLPVFKT